MPIKIPGAGGGGGDVQIEKNTVIYNYSGDVTAGDAVLSFVDVLRPNEILEINQAYLVDADGTPAPSDLNLVIATLDGTGGGALQTELLSGDGSTTFYDVEDPGEYTNNTSNSQSVAILVNNGHFGTGTGSTETIAAGAVGTVGEDIQLEAPSVITLDSSNIQSDQADLSGELTDTGGYTNIRLLIETKLPGDSIFDVDDDQPVVKNPQEFSATVTGLDVGQTYDYRAAVQYADTALVRGDTKQFSTLALIFEGFESGDISKWDSNVSEFVATTDVAFEGSFSGGAWKNSSTPGDGFTLQQDLANWKPNGLDGGEQIEEFEYYFYETTASAGGGMRLYDSAGDPVMAIGTDNPQWKASDGTGSFPEIYSGDGNRHWTLQRVTFDWSAGTYDYFIEDTSSGTTRSGTLNLARSTDVETINYVNIQNPQSVSNLNGSGSTSEHDHVNDNITITP